MFALQEPRVIDREFACDRLLRAIDGGEARCGVIGLGFIGSVLMDALIDAGFAAAGYDRFEGAVERYRAHHAARAVDSRRPVVLGAVPDALDECDVLFVAVRNPVLGSTIDEEPMRAVERCLEARTVRPRLILLESTVSPGATRRFAAAIGAAGDGHIFVAHAPERLSAGHDHTALRAMPHLVGGLDEQSTRLGSAMLRRICDQVIPVSSPEVSEMSKLLENAFLSVNIGLVNEVTRLAVDLGIRAREVCAAAATKPSGFMAFHPGPGVGGHCLPNDLQLLTDAVRTRGWEPGLLSGAMAANDRAPSVVVDRLAGLFAARGAGLAGAAVLIVGLGFKTGSPDTTRSPAYEVIRELRQRGADLSYCDSLVESFEVDGIHVAKTRALDLREGQFAAAVILSGDSQLPERALVAASALVLDAGGSRGPRASLCGIETL